MGSISLSLPVVGQPNSTEDPKLITDLTTLQTVINGNIDSTNITAGLAQSASVNLGGQKVKGFSNVSTSQSTGSTTFTTLTTPDQVTGIVLPANGLLAVWFSAVWSESVNNGARATIFLNGVQIQVAVSGGNSVEEAQLAQGSGGQSAYLTSSPFGLSSTWSGFSAYTSPVSTGQAIAATSSNSGGPCYLFAAAGTYTVTVQFKASSGTVTASNRQLWVQALSFA